MPANGPAGTTDTLRQADSARSADDASAGSIFNTDMSSLFPRRKRFGAVNVLLLGGLVSWIVLVSDVRLWLREGVSTFASETDRTPAASAGPLRRSCGPPTAAPIATPDRVHQAAANTRSPVGRPARPTGSLTDANRSFQTGDYHAAEAGYRAALAVRPDDASALNNLGQTLVPLGRPDDARGYQENAVDLAPDRWDYQFTLAHTLGELGWWGRAVNGYQRAAQLAPADHATRYNLGHTLHASGDYREAVRNYLIAIKLAPNDASFYVSLGQSYEAMSRYSEAKTAYARYVEMESSSPEAAAVRAHLATVRSSVTGSTEGP